MKNEWEGRRFKAWASFRPRLKLGIKLKSDDDNEVGFVRELALGTSFGGDEGVQEVRSDWEK